MHAMDSHYNAVSIVLRYAPLESLLIVPCPYSTVTCAAFKINVGVVREEVGPARGGGREVDGAGRALQQKGGRIFCTSRTLAMVSLEHHL